MVNRSGQHFVALDLYRFVAATAVVVFHIAQFHIAHGKLYAVIGKFNLFVDFFFVLSGFVIAYGYGGKIDTWSGVVTFMRRRFARLYPLHLLTLGMFLVAIAGLAVLHKAPPNPEKYSLSLLPGQFLLMQSWPLNAPLQFNYPAWSISVEFAMYLLFPLLMLSLRRFGIWSLVAVALLGVVAMEVLLATGAMHVDTMDENYSPIRGIPTFTVGIIIAVTYREMRYGIALGFAALLVSVALMLAHANDYAIIAAFCVSIYLTACGEAANPYHVLNRPIVRAMGDASYSIYMLHAFVLIGFFSIFWRHNEVEPGVLYTLGLVALVWAMSIVTFRWFERPMRDLLSGRRKKAQPLPMPS